MRYESTPMQGVRHFLSSKERTDSLLAPFIDKAIEEEAAALGEAEDKNAILNVLRYSLETFYQNAIELVYTRSESEIEKIFLNSLILSFLMADPLGLIVQPPLRGRNRLCSTISRTLQKHDFR